MNRCPENLTVPLPTLLPSSLIGLVDSGFRGCVRTQHLPLQMRGVDGCRTEKVPHTGRRALVPLDFHVDFHVNFHVGRLHAEATHTTCDPARWPHHRPRASVFPSGNVPLGPVIVGESTCAYSRASRPTYSNSATIIPLVPCSKTSSSACPRRAKKPHQAPLPAFRFASYR